MLTVNQYLAKKEISKEQFDSMTAEEIAKVYNEINENNVAYIKELEENGATAKELSEALAEINKEQAAKLEKVLLAVEKQGIAVAKLFKKDAPKGTTLKDILAENKNAISDIAKGMSTGEVVLKADTNLASIDSNTSAFVIPGIGQLGYKKLNASEIFPIIPITGDNINADVKYFDWDEDTIVRAAAMVAECAVFPESTAKWKQYNCPIRKIGDTIPVCEEFFEDEAMFAAELQMFLITNVDIKVDDQIVNGDNTGQNLKGLFVSSPAYVAPNAGISDASIYDLLVKVSEDITTDRGSKYSPDFALMNIADINRMKLKKDANENYILPPFVTRDGREVDGMTIIEDNHVTANSMIVGDRRYAKIYQRAGMTVSKGLVNAQFTEDQMTLKVRKRLVFIMREVDKTGFRKVTDIDAALIALAI